jgi:tetratricopeptide (TPR) repeat protein
MRAYLSPAVLLSIGIVCAHPQSDPLPDAVAALQRGDLSSAEQLVRAELSAHPNSAEAFGVLGVVLDRQNKYGEADQAYRRAVALSSRSPALLNNYGNHLLNVGKLNEARGVFLRVIALNPAQANALLQLAWLSLARELPVEALGYLDRIPASSRHTADAELARMQALYGAHRDAEAEAIYSRLSTAAAQGGASLSYSLGVALASARQYGKAEEVLSRALIAAPSNFDVLYKLGLAAAHAGHNERARDILQSALRQQPQNVDVLYDLAAVNAALGQRETAVDLAASAAQLAAERADVQQLLARTTADAGYFGDSVQAWDRYLKLVPGDDIARRERAFAVTAIGEDMAGGLAGLRAFVAKHPRDAVGRYELGVAEAATTPGDALTQLNRALAIHPELTAAHVARGLLYFKQAKFALALSDFEIAARREPANAVVLDRLGQTYMALERPADAVPILRRAAELAPRDSKTLMHLGRALTSAGHDRDAREVFARFRELGPDRSGLPHPAGLVDFLSLSPQEQLARYRAGVERTVRRNPENAEAQVRYLKLLLDEGNTAEASAVAQRIIELKPSSQILSDAGGALLAAEQYAAARSVLEQAANPTAELLLNRAIAESHAVNAQAGLDQLDRIPQAQRSADYYLTRSRMLDSCGRAGESAAALNDALLKSPARPELYRYATTLLIGKRRFQDAFQLLDRGSRKFPDNPEILLLRAITLEAVAKTPDAEQLLSDIEKRWPDWSLVWLAHAILMQWQDREKQADQMVDVASALGARNAKEQLARAAAFPRLYPESTERAAKLMGLLFPGDENKL